MFLYFTAWPFSLEAGRWMNYLGHFTAVRIRAHISDPDPLISIEVCLFSTAANTTLSDSELKNKMASKKDHFWVMAAVPRILELSPRAAAGNP